MGINLIPECHVNKAYLSIAATAIEDFKANQDYGPLVQLLILARALKPKNILEIGTNTGGTAYALSTILEDKGTIYTIDINKNNIIKSVLANPKIKFIEGNSYAPEIFSKIQYLLGDNKLDILFIDGDHSFFGVKNDFDMYFPLVRKNGIIIIHDILTKAFPEPGQFWEQLISNHPVKYCELYIFREADQNNPEPIWNKNVGIIFKETE